MPRSLGPGLVLLLGAMLGSAARAQDIFRFDGHYVGELSLSGIVSGDCTTPPPGAEYPLAVSRGTVRFKYVPRFNTTLTGVIDAKGNFKATAKLHHGVATMTGRIVGERVIADIVSPSCRYRFQTKN
jgi:hypothetical protein